MCDTFGTSRAKELERLEKSWQEFEELVQWVKHRWSRRDSPVPAETDAGPPGKAHPVTG